MLARNVIDLRSDTVTKPTQAMRDAMARAVVGDDGYREDPTVNELEARAAKIVGMEAALFVPSGTMGNLCALIAQTKRGDEVLLDRHAHIGTLEQGGIALIAGLPYRALPSHRGVMDLGEVAENLEPRGYAKSKPRLVCLEVSHNASGGAVPPLDYLANVRKLAGQHGVAVHIDGARLFNAAVALNTPASAIARFAETVTFCLSKGLSAPAGSVLCGPSGAIDRARDTRKLLGGAMRQAGILAAAGIVALETMIDRLHEDHSKAKALARGLAAIDARLCDVQAVETNIVNVDAEAAERSAPVLSERLAAEGVLVRAWGPRTIRLVTHADFAAEDVDVVIEAFRRA